MTKPEIIFTNRKKLQTREKERSKFSFTTTKRRCLFALIRGNNELFFCVPMQLNQKVVYHVSSTDAFRKEPDLELEGLLKRHYTTVEFFQGTMMNAVDLERVKVRVRQNSAGISLPHGRNLSLIRVYVIQYFYLFMCIRQIFFFCIKDAIIVTVGFYHLGNFYLVVLLMQSLLFTVGGWRLAGATAPAAGRLRSTPRLHILVLHRVAW